MQNKNRVSGVARRQLRKERSILRILIRDFWRDYNEDVEMYKSYNIEMHYPKSHYEKHYNILVKLLNDLDEKLRHN